MPRRKKIEEIKAFIEGEEGNGCKLVSTEYINNYSPLLIKCACGNDFITTYKMFTYKKKRQCNECGNKDKVRWDYTFKQVKEIIEQAECKLLSDTYINSQINLDIVCSCGKPFSVNFYRFIRYGKQQCDECSYKIKNRKITLRYDEIKRFIEIDSDSGCELISETYEGVYEKLQIRCQCGEMFTVRFHDFDAKYQRQCKKCSKAISQGELAIKKYYDDNNYKYSMEYLFADCKDKDPLPFDFARLNDDKSIKFLIEFQGEQHYKVVEFWGGEEGLKYRQLHDEIKREYCKNNNIKLIEIPYWDFKNINIILDRLEDK